MTEKSFTGSLKIVVNKRAKDGRHGRQVNTTDFDMNYEGCMFFLLKCKLLVAAPPDFLPWRIHRRVDYRSILYVFCERR
jgi:hypothetical protein